MADRITLTGMDVYGYHGVLEHEREYGQTFTVDITCWLDPAQNDDLDTTVNYAELAQLAHDVVAGPPRQLIETVAGEIADTALDTWALLHAIEVTVHKPHAPIPLPFGDVAVTARRNRMRRS